MRVIATGVLSGAAGSEELQPGVSARRTGETEGGELETGETVQLRQSTTGASQPRVDL